jgi:glucosamine--fructose-6-phosphate aminotransferase (isomerizing)
MSDMPELRDGPPWAMEEMILAEPGLVSPIFASPEAFEAAEWLRETETVVVTGCGTSEHAAMAGAALLGARPRDAFEASLDPQSEGVLIAVSHEAGTAATLAAIKATNARTILITARPELETGADLTITTPLVDTSWCHTVGYVSPLLAFTAIAGATDASTASRVIEDTLAQRATFEAAARTLQGCERLIVTGSGLDEITARELALKIEEGLHVPVTPLGIEKVLHGHLPAADSRTGIVVLRIDPSAAEQRDKRARDVLNAVAELKMPAVTIGDGLPAGHPLLAGAIALQLLTYELVLAAGTNPDLIRREEDAYRAAAAAANT